MQRVKVIFRHAAFFLRKNTIVRKFAEFPSFRHGIGGPFPLPWTCISGASPWLLRVYYSVSPVGRPAHWAHCPWCGRYALRRKRM